MKITSPNTRAMHDDYRLIAKYLQKFLKSKDNLLILDTGCASGQPTIDLLRKLDIHHSNLYGIEINPHQIEKAEANGFEIIGHDLHDTIPLEESSLDLIFSIQVIEHLYFTDQYLEQLHRLLKPGGILILTTTNLAAWHYRLQLTLGYQPVCLHPSTYGAELTKNMQHPLYGHHSVFTHNYLKKVLQHHNFKILKDYTHSIFPLPHSLSLGLTRLFDLGTFSCFVLSK